MPIVTPANAYLVGLAKQTNEATVPATAAYSLPVFSSDIGPTYDLRRIEVTDSASIEGDPYKGPSSWAAGGIEVPAFDDSLGTILVGLWPTDTKTGAGPYVHTYSGLGGSQPWMAFYSHWTDAGINYEQTFGKGLITGLTFSVSSEGGPLRVGIQAMGQEVTGATAAAFPATVADLLTAGWFGLQLTGATIELDIDSPNVAPTVAVTNVRSASVTVARNASAEPTATGITVANIAQGKVANTGSMEVLWDSVALDTYRSSYFGSAAGTSLSATLVYGALELNFKHSVTAAHAFTLYFPKVGFRAAPAVPNPDGSALSQSIELFVAKPTTGDHVQPVLTNSVVAAY